MVLNTKYVSLLDEYPDLHSGYKLYSRDVCERIVQTSWERPPWVGPEIYRYGVEAVPFVEGALAGALVGETTRATREPAFSGHGGFARPESNAGVMRWAFLRLGIGPAQAAPLLDNHISRLTLWTDPLKRDDLLQLRRSVLEPLFQAAHAPRGPAELVTNPYF
jgi:hypothetical protein